MLSPNSRVQLGKATASADALTGEPAAHFPVAGQSGLFPLAADTRDRVVTCCGRALGSGRPTLGLGGSPTAGLPGQKPQDIPWGRRESRLCRQVTASSRTFIRHSQTLGCGWERHSTDTAHSPPTPTPVTQPLSPASCKAHSFTPSTARFPSPYFVPGIMEGHSSDQSHH